MFPGRVDPQAYWEIEFSEARTARLLHLTVGDKRRFTVGEPRWLELLRNDIVFRQVVGQFPFIFHHLVTRNVCEEMLRRNYQTMG